MAAFTEPFFWGSSSSGPQYEGALHEDGKADSVFVLRQGGAWERAIDGYHRYEEDFDLLQQLGMNCHRFSIAWSRVIPTGDGEVNQAALDHYGKVIDALIERGIEPVVCLYHYDMPYTLYERMDGFASAEAADAFVRYAKIVIDAFADRVHWWITFNEQNMFGFEECFQVAGSHPGDERKRYQIQHNTMVAHAKVCNYVHEMHPECKIGGMVHYQKIYPSTPHPADTLDAQIAERFYNGFCLDMYAHGRYPGYMLAYLKNRGIEPDMRPGDLEALAAMKNDFIAMSYYYTACIDHTLVPADATAASYIITGERKNPYLDATAWGWQVDPVGLRTVVTDVYARYGLPVFIFENGFSAREDLPEDGVVSDDYRIAYHRGHIQALRDAIELDGAEVIGYLVWGVIDLPSSQGALEKRYGMVYVEHSEDSAHDLTRHPKKSFSWMQRVIASHGEDLGDAEKDGAFAYAYAGTDGSES